MPGVAHGGYVAGLLTVALGASGSRVRLRRPVPTGRALQIEHGGLVEGAGVRQAVVLLQLVEAGQLSLDGPVQRYLPWFAIGGSRDAARITAQAMEELRALRPEHSRTMIRLKLAGHDSTTARDLEHEFGQLNSAERLPVLDAQVEEALRRLRALLARPGSA